jgi:hypothetical protein
MFTEQLRVSALGKEPPITDSQVAGIIDTNHNTWPKGALRERECWGNPQFYLMLCYRGCLSLQGRPVSILLTQLSRQTLASSSDGFYPNASSGKLSVISHGN